MRIKHFRETFAISSGSPITIDSEDEGRDGAFQIPDATRHQITIEGTATVKFKEQGHSVFTTELTETDLTNVVHLTHVSQIEISSPDSATVSVTSLSGN